jgi:hypothetical protein
MAFPPRDKTLQGLLRDFEFRLTTVERRLINAAGGGGGGGSGGWVDLSAAVTWAPGWSYFPDSAGWKGIKARRVGHAVEFVIGNARAAAGTFQVPTNGNVANALMFSNVPAKFRPPAGMVVAFSIGPAGPLAAISMREDGTVSLTAVVPDATQTATIANPLVDFSAMASYRVD